MLAWHVGSHSVLAGLAGVTAWVLAAAGPAAYAQTQQAKPPAQSEQKPEMSEKPDLSDQKLDAAAAAIRDVAGIKQEFEQKIAAADPADKGRVTDEARTALEKAVTDRGLSLAEYSSILTVAQNDPDVKEKIIQRLRAQTEGRKPPGQ